MTNDIPLSQLDFIADEIEYLREDQVAHLKVQDAMARGMDLVAQLDPLMREHYRDKPETLAEWDEIMQDYYEIRDERKKGG